MRPAKAWFAACNTLSKIPKICNKISRFIHFTAFFVLVTQTNCYFSLLRSVSRSRMLVLTVTNVGARKSVFLLSFLSVLISQNWSGKNWCQWRQTVHQQCVLTKLVSLVYWKKRNQLGLSRPFAAVHCIVHQEALCAKSLQKKNVMDVVVKTVNFVRARRLNHKQLTSFWPF